MSEPTGETMELLIKRCRRLAQFVEYAATGADVPDQVIDDECRMVTESIRQLQSERNAGRN